jgi:phosphoribosyl-AMP cyclohydrolase / phosphoribosyl-ATP pyrophosphohydrolase
VGTASAPRAAARVPPAAPIRSAGRISPVDIAFDENGLVPCVVQDARTGEVLTLAYMNEEALARTRETGEVHFWSRSRGELWRKGQSSGNVMRLRALRYDCDEDALLALVDPAGPACHTGERTCFYRGDMEPQAAEAVATLGRTIADRRRSAPAGSYTAELLADPPMLAGKVREEAAEVAAAASDEPAERVAEEAADVLYHLAVLMASRGLALEDAFEVLNGRRR